MDFKIVKLGKLKHARVKAMSLLRGELNAFGKQYTIEETKIFLESFLQGAVLEVDSITKVCLDCIFTGNKYQIINVEPQEKNFPDNFIPPVG